MDFVLLALPRELQVNMTAVTIPNQHLLTTCEVSGIIGTDIEGLPNLIHIPYILSPYTQLHKNPLKEPKKGVNL